MELKVIHSVFNNFIFWVPITNFITILYDFCCKLSYLIILLLFGRFPSLLRRNISVFCCGSLPVWKLIVFQGLEQWICLMISLINKALSQVQIARDFCNLSSKGKTTQNFLLGSLSERISRHLKYQYVLPIYYWTFQIIELNCCKFCYCCSRTHC